MKMRIVTVLFAAIGSWFCAAPGMAQRVLYECRAVDTSASVEAPSRDAVTVITSPDRTRKQCNFTVHLVTQPPTSPSDAAIASIFSGDAARFEPGQLIEAIASSLLAASDEASLARRSSISGRDQIDVRRIDRNALVSMLRQDVEYLAGCLRRYNERQVDEQRSIGRGGPISTYCVVSPANQSHANFTFDGLVRVAGNPMQLQIAVRFEQTLIYLFIPRG